MPYRLRKRETISDGTKRILQEQTGAIISALSDRGGDLDGRIHDVRKRLKRVRAVLRLVTLKLDSDALEVRDSVLRGVGRRLSPARDATVILGRFEEIAVHFTGSAIDRIRELLGDAVKHAKRKLVTPEKLAVLAAEIRSVAGILARVGTVEEGWPAVEHGLSSSYRTARKHVRAAFADPEVDNLHECRRHSKWLWEQLRLVRRALPKPQVRMLPRLEKFCDILGHYHDFYMLQMALNEAAAHGLEVAKFPALHKRINREMGKCLKRARRLGTSVFVLRPKAMIARIHAGWKQWHGKK
jgi:CHAD domain-containing protein